MSVTAAVPLGPMPSAVAVARPLRSPNIGSSAMSGGAVTSPVPIRTQPPPQVNQASPTPSNGQNSPNTNLRLCKFWIKSHPLLSIAGIVIALATLFVGYYQARAANIFTSKGNSLARTALDYIRYQTWCQNSGMASNYTWCQEHRTPDTFDPAFDSNQRRSLYQSFDSLKSTCLTYIGGNNDWLEEKWREGAYWALYLHSLFFIVFLVCHYATTMSKPADPPKWQLHFVELDVDKKQIQAAVFIVMLLVSFLGTIPMVLMQRPLEDFVFYGIAAIMLVSGLWGQSYSSLDDRRLNDFDSIGGMICYLWYILLIVLSVCTTSITARRTS